MREFDHNGLLLAEFQGKLFEKSAELNCSSSIFIRRFLHSNLLKEIDNGVTNSLDVNEAIYRLTQEFGEFNYGTQKYSASSLFWIGYMYRYIAYTRELETSFVMSLFKYQQMNTVYYSYHTQDPEWCIKSLLNLNNLPEEIFDNNYRLKMIIRKRNEETCLYKLDKQV